MNQDIKKHWSLYILRLQDGKFYVGITSKTPEKRMQEHLNSIRAAYWTAKHKPIEIIYTENLGTIEKSKAEKRENKMVRALMKQRGLNNVRGGNLTSVNQYVRRFGYIRDKDEWQLILYIVFLSLLLSYFIIDKCFFGIKK